MTYEFDKAVPIPTAVERVGVNIELLRAMQPGESKWWSVEDAKKASRFYRVAKKLNIPIVIRKVGANDPRGPGMRMWRNEGGAAPVDPIAAAAEAAAKKVAKKPLPKTSFKESKAAKKPAKKAAKVSLAETGILPAPHKKEPRKPRPSELAKRKFVEGVPSTPAALKKAQAAAS